jgi:hypothetical protein
VSQNDLLDAVKQLDTAEFRHFVTEVLDLRAARQAPRVSQAEADLLRRINAGLPQDIRRRYRELVDDRRADTLTFDEHAELLRLSDEVEGARPTG